MVKCRKKMKNIQQEIGERIKKHRVDMHLTQSALADKLFVTDKVISKWEKGKSVPDISILLELSEIFNISIEYLITGKENKSTSNNYNEQTERDKIKAENSRWLQELVNRLETSERDKLSTEEDRLPAAKEMFLACSCRCLELMCKTIDLAKYCQSCGEPYILCGCAASSSIFYLAGITKFDPQKIGARSETFLGTFKNPRLVKMIEIRVRPSFVSKLQKKCLEINKEYTPYYLKWSGIGIDKCLTYFFPSDFSAGSDCKEMKGLPFKVLPYSYWEKSKLGFAIVPCSFLEPLKGVPIFEKEKYDESIILINKELLKGNLLSLGIHIENKNNIFNIKENLELNDIISIVSRSYSSTEAVDPISPFDDRDSVFSYFNRIVPDVDTCYSIMEDVRKGKGARVDFSPYELPDEIVSKFSKIKYLCSRAHSAEFVYYHLLKALRGVK